MRKKDEEVIKKVVDKIIDSKVLLTGDGDFRVETIGDDIFYFEISNLFSVESRIHKVIVHFAWALDLIDKEGNDLASFGISSVPSNDLEKSPSFKRLVEYIEENKHLILHNDKEYGKSHTLSNTDFI